MSLGICPASVRFLVQAIYLHKCWWASCSWSPRPPWNPVYFPGYISSHGPCSWSGAVGRPLKPLVIKAPSKPRGIWPLALAGSQDIPPALQSGLCREADSWTVPPSLLSQGAPVVAAFLSQGGAPSRNASQCGQRRGMGEAERYLCAGRGISSPFVLFRFLLCLLLKGPC